MTEQTRNEADLGDEIRARARGYTTESVNFQWIEAGVIIDWADEAAKLKKELAEANEELTYFQPALEDAMKMLGEERHRAAELKKELLIEQMALARAVARGLKRERFMYTDAKFAKILAAEREQHRTQARAELGVRLSNQAREEADREAED